MKRSELIFATIILPIDFVMVVLAGVAAYYLRFEEIVTGIRPVGFALPFPDYLKLVLLVAVAWMVVFALAGLYRMRGTRRIVDEISRVFLAASTGILIVITFFFFQRELFASRFILLAAWTFSIVFVIFGRLVVLLIQRAFFKRGIGARKVVIVGSDSTANRLAEEFKSRLSMGYRVIKRIDKFDDQSHQVLKELVKEGIDEIIQTGPRDQSESLNLLAFANKHHIVFKYSADLFASRSTNMEIVPVAGIPVVEMKTTRLDGWGRVYKRLFDVVGSSILIVLTSPIMIITALAIKFGSRIPVFFPIERVGQFGKPFKHFKFRSMIPGTHGQRYKELAAEDLRKGSPLVKIKDDPRITRVGKFIRRFSIDELPEFFLVLKGKMSLVGPRPHLPEEVDKYKRYHKKVLTLKPGITGFAQVSGRSDLDFEEEIKIDIYYIEHWSPLLDLYILLKTPIAVFSRRAAE